MCYTGKCLYEMSGFGCDGDCDTLKKDRESSGKCPDYMLKYISGPADICEICKTNEGKLYGYNVICDKCWGLHYTKGLEDSNSKDNSRS